MEFIAYNTLQDELSKDNKELNLELQKMIGKEVSFFAMLLMSFLNTYVLMWTEYISKQNGPL